MRHRTVIVSGLATLAIGLALGLGGCAPSSADEASPGAFGASTSNAIGPLGAGDRYGAMVYTAYLASRADADDLEVYATAPTDYAPE